MALLPAISTDYRLFLPYSGMPTLIRIKRKKLDFRASSVVASVSSRSTSARLPKI